MDRIFKSVGYGSESASYDSLFDPDSYEYRVRAMIVDARNFEETDLAPQREENQEYYYGLRPVLEVVPKPPADQLPDPWEELPEDPGRSTVVSTDVRDTVMAVMPSLMRCFAAGEKPCEFDPNTEAQNDMAQQITDYIAYIFWEENDGFLALHSAFKDALTVKTGIIKWWTDYDTEVAEEEYQNITQEQLQSLYGEDPNANVEVLEVAHNPNGTLSCRIRWTKNKPSIHVEAVPPEEFRISRFARTVSKSPLLGHERIVQPSELIKMGYDEEELEGFMGATIDYGLEKQLRNPGEDFGSRVEEGIQYGEYYIRIDGDGDGIDELRRICTIGNNAQIVMDEVVEYVNFAVFCPDPRSHTVVGDALADLAKDIQRVKTNMLRGALDSLAQSIFSRTVVNEITTNVDDALNQEIGAIIRTTGDVNASVSTLQTPFVGQAIFPMFEYIDRVRQSRTGISEASKGVDPRALQSTNVMGIDAIVTGAQERIELIARILAETGLKDLYKGILREVVNNPNAARTVKLRGKWVNINPSTFDATLRVTVNPTIGRGSDLTRLLALRDVKETQLMIMTKYGLSNPMVTPVEFRNTLVDMLAIANVRNPARYFKEVTPEQMQAIAQQPKEPDPALMLAQSEMEKVRSQTAQKIAELDEKTATERRKDDFNRDKLTIESILKAAEIIAKHNAEIEEQKLLESKNQPPINGATH